MSFIYSDFEKSSAAVSGPKAIRRYPTVFATASEQAEFLKRLHEARLNPTKRPLQGHVLSWPTWLIHEIRDTRSLTKLLELLCISDAPSLVEARDFVLRHLHAKYPEYK